MSDGPRFTLEQGRRVADALFERWGLSGLREGGVPECVVVGSVRRQRPDIGDLEIIAPVPDGLPDSPTPADDPLFRRINATMETPWADERAPLFGPEAVTPENPVGRIVKGLRPGFLAASIDVIPWKDAGHPMAGTVLRVEVYRYTKHNRGWIMLMRTGPSEFGQWFLGRWKKAMGIPVGGDDPASVNGHLVTSSGRVFPVETEEDCFRVIGTPPIAPEDRGPFMERMRASREALR